jgi:hypothetical protein
MGQSRCGNPVSSRSLKPLRGRPVISASRAADLAMHGFLLMVFAPRLNIALGAPVCKHNSKEVAGEWVIVPGSSPDKDRGRCVNRLAQQNPIPHTGCDLYRENRANLCQTSAICLRGIVRLLGLSRKMAG